MIFKDWHRINERTFLHNGTIHLNTETQASEPVTVTYLTTNDYNLFMVHLTLDEPMR